MFWHEIGLTDQRSSWILNHSKTCWGLAIVGQSWQSYRTSQGVTIMTTCYNMWKFLDWKWLWPWKLVTTWQRVIMTVKACYNMTRCDNGGWCGERRKNTTTGAVQRCADRTRCSSRSLSLWTSWSNIMFLIVRYGKSCASTCGKGDNDYHWCWVGWHLEDVILIICHHMTVNKRSHIYWWRFVISGLGVLRTSGSNQIWGGLCWRLRSEGEELLVMFVFNCIFNVDYLARARWCYTDKEEKEWEYCSPPGEVSFFQSYITSIGLDTGQSLNPIWVWRSLQVLDTAYTVNGQDCVGECGTQGEKYWWEWCKLFCIMNAFGVSTFFKDIYRCMVI